jgi:16S rRNA processing protein RimM
LLRFEGVDDRDAADALRGQVLRAPALEGDVLDEGEFWVHELVGTRVVAVDGRVLGIVAAVEANPAHDQLVLDGGELVPLVFVTEQRDGDVVVDVPEGLFEL